MSPWKLGTRSLLKAMNFPSGDHVGCWSAPRPVVSCRRWLPSGSMVKMSSPGPLRELAKAILPSILAAAAEGTDAVGGANAEPAQAAITDDNSAARTNTLVPSLPWADIHLLPRLRVHEGRIGRDSHGIRRLRSVLSTARCHVGVRRGWCPPNRVKSRSRHSFGRTVDTTKYISTPQLGFTFSPLR